MTPITEVDTLDNTVRQKNGFGSTEKISSMYDFTIPTKSYEYINSLISTYTPTMVEMSLDPHENLINHEIKVNGNQKTLGLDLVKCPIRQLPKLQKCIKGTPSAKISKWRSTLKYIYIYSINNTKMTFIPQIKR